MSAPRPSSRALDASRSLGAAQTVERPGSVVAEHVEDPLGEQLDPEGPGVERAVDVQDSRSTLGDRGEAGGLGLVARRPRD